MTIENQISKTKSILLDLSSQQDKSNALQYLIENFCGIVIKDLSEVQDSLNQQRVYACGDLSKLKSDAIKLFIIKEFSHNYDNLNHQNIQFVALGQVPILVHSAGVYFRNLFGEKGYFDKIKSEHVFQELTESTKPSNALRKGIYLSEIWKEETKDKSEKLHFHLLRCSSNLNGPTDNFRDTDHHIINTLNDAIKYTFEQETKLNHVLAQIYENKKKPNDKEVKAKIKAHSDKTKDMPKDGLIAFCTFYNQSEFEHLSPSETDQYDWCYKNKTGLTRLHFKLKKSVNNDSLAKEFSVTLYPNSAFLIPLSTNRLYTHEIKPSILNIDKIPVRLGYVARCSNLEAVYMNDQTYIKENGELIKLEQMTPETLKDLRNTYYEENKSEKMVNYGKVHFSMNTGDYEKPIY